jgi:hypothetical protein
MTRFSKLGLVDGKLVETNIREIAQSDMLKCPHAIMMAEHYREDGTCRCNDPTALVMREWGYRWHLGQWRAEEES